MVKQLKIIVEKHPDGYVAYSLGLKGVVVGEGDTYEEVLMDVKSAVAFHAETFMDQLLEKPLEIQDFQPLLRDDIYLERSFGAWADDRTVEETLQEIYASRKSKPEPPALG
jgi:predicted RNase H-like HicB family nuclease